MVIVCGRQRRTPTNCPNTQNTGLLCDELAPHISSSHLIISIIGPLWQQAIVHFFLPPFDFFPLAPPAPPPLA